MKFQSQNPWDESLGVLRVRYSTGNYEVQCPWCPHCENKDYLSKENEDFKNHEWGPVLWLAEVGRPLKRKGLGPARAASGDQAHSKKKPNKQKPGRYIFWPLSTPHPQKGHKKMEAWHSGGRWRTRQRRSMKQEPRRLAFNPQGRHIGGQCLWCKSWAGLTFFTCEAGRHCRLGTQLSSDLALACTEPWVQSLALHWTEQSGAQL